MMNSAICGTSIATEQEIPDFTLGRAKGATRGHASGLLAVPAGESKSKGLRYLNIQEDDRSTKRSSRLGEASLLPGERM
jgi:hypothetical protein